MRSTKWGLSLWVAGAVPLLALGSAAVRSQTLPDYKTPSGRQGDRRCVRRSEAFAAGDDRCAGWENFLSHGWGIDGGRQDRGTGARSNCKPDSRNIFPIRSPR